MSDIKVTITGDGSGGKRAFEDAGEGAKEFGEAAAIANFKLDAMIGAIKKAASEIYEFAKKSVEASESQAKADRNLQRVAGEMTETFKKQASAMQEALGVSDDMVQGIQTMLLGYGVAQTEVEATTKAILDYSAATGKDATEATAALLKGVQSGKTVMKELGLEYDKTGVATTDLSNVTGALAKRFGGAADAEANTFGGSARKAAQAVEEFQESIGALITEFVNKTGALTTFTEAIRTLQELLFNTTEEKYHARALAQAKALELQADAYVSLKNAQLDYDKAVANPNSSVSQLEFLHDILQSTKKEAEAATAAVRGTLSSVDPALSNKASGRKTGSGKKEQIQEEREAERTYTEIQDELDLNQALQNEQRRKDALEKYFEDIRNIELKNHDKSEKQAEQLIEQREAMLKRHMDKLRAVQEAENKKYEQQMENAGAAIGMAMISAISGAMDSALAGGEVDLLGKMADLFFGIAAIVGQTVASIYGGPIAGQLVGTGISLAGSIASNERRRAWKREQDAKKKKHDGGWIEPERYHSGGWPGLGTDEQTIIAQTGERMLSKVEVGRMGGQRGVDAAAQGNGGGGNITINAFSTQSMMEMFQGGAGRAVYNAIRTGRGQLTPLFE